MKLHIGSGTVYLREWVNVDLPCPNVYLARERKDLVERFITDESRYYGRHDDKTADSLRSGPVTNETVCDIYGSFAFLPARPHSVSEILARQVFEHLDKQEAIQGLLNAKSVLKAEGVLRIDIPDPDETLRKYHQTGDEFYIRHLFGPRRDLYGFHTHYTRKMLVELAGECGFSFVAEEENIHFYPAYCLRFTPCV